MSGEKTHSATPRRRQEARKKGQILKSAELSSGIEFLAVFLVLKFWLPSLSTQLAQFARFILQWQVKNELSISMVQQLMMSAVMVVIKGVAPIAAVVVVTGIFVNFLQVGSLFTLTPLTPDLQRLNPVNGFQKMFSVRSLVELVKSLLKLSLLGYILYSSISSNLVPQLPEIEQASIFGGVSILGNILVGLAWKAALVFIILGIADYLYQWWEYERSLKMSREELKEEFKSTEGDPHVRAAIKRRQRAMASRRMMQEVPKADVVITNPTHFAVAIHYDNKAMQAPVVLAKGQDEVALKIRMVAEEHKVPLVENPPLARSLFRNVDIGQPVPPQLYKAVAEVLAFVYRLNRKRIS